LILYAGHVQGNILDKNLGSIPKGQKSKVSPNAMPVNENIDIEYFWQAWMVVYL
jgi:hypothetical protein